MSNRNVIDDKEIVEIEKNIQKQLQKYAIEPKKVQTVKRYSDKYYKSKLNNTKKVQKMVEYEILPDELRKLLKAKKQASDAMLDSSSTQETEKEEDDDIEDDENDYNIDYENNEEEFMDDEECKEDEYES